MASAETTVKSATSMASGGAGNVIVPATSTAEASQSNPASSTGLPPVDPTGKGKRKKGDKAGKFRSEVWLYFEKIEKPVFETVDGKMQQVRTVTRAQCKYCSTDLACDPYENGTSSLRRHIQDVCKKYPGRADIEKGQTLLGGDGSLSVSGEPSLAVKLWSQDRCRVAAVEMIVMDELPFSAIERKGFMHFCSVAVPKWEIPSRRTIVKLFLKMYDAKKVELRKELHSHSVCLTTDTWTSVQNINYMVLTAHFIDYGWKMHKRILNFCVISNHSGNSIGKLIELCLIQWGIEKVLTISVDNAAANKHAIDYVRKKMVNWSKKPVLGGKFLHVRCLAHILNLIVRSGLTMLDRSVGSIRNAVKYVRSSSSRLEVFKKCVEKEKLESKKICVLDVPTRWNSTFIMLETALELKKAFYRMADEEDSKYESYFDEPEPEDNEAELEDGFVVVDPKTRKRIGPPNEHDWEKAAIFVQFLKVFYEVTLRVSASNKPTSHRAFHDIVSIQAEIEDLFDKDEDDFEHEAHRTLHHMAVKMKAKFTKYFAKLEDMNQLLLVALVLDPRYKLRNFGSTCRDMLGYDGSQVKKASDELKELVVQLTDLYATSNGPQKGRTSSESCITGGRTGSSSSSTRTLSGKRADMLKKWKTELRESEEVVVQHEVDRYCLDPIEDPPEEEDWDILMWWRLNGVKYPNLQLVAKDVLAVQVSTVASESAFSTGGRVIDPYRSSMTPRTVEALICMQNWINSTSISEIEYFPTTEEFEFYERMEKEHQLEDTASSEKARAGKLSKAAKITIDCDAAGASNTSS